MDSKFSEMADVFPTQAAAEARYIAIFGTRTRFVLMVLVLFCLTSIWSNILAFNMAVVCMNEEYDEHRNDTVLITNRYTTINQSQQSWSIFVVACAALLGNFPVVQLIGKFGIRTVFGGLGLLSAISTILLPFAIKFGFAWMLVVRAFQGLAFAANFPVIGAFCAKWTYFKQNGLFVSALVAYVQLAPTFTNPTSGFICSAFRWPSIFFAHGVVSLLLFVTYTLFYRNNPGKHPFVGGVELRKISIGKIANVDKRALKSVPYGAVLSTPAVWAVWIASLGNFTCVNMMFLFSPTYLSAVLGYSAHSTGVTAALGPFSQFCVKIICGAISDRIKFVSESTKFRIFNSVAFFGSAIFLVVLAFMGNEHRSWNMIVLGAAAGILGTTTGGFFKAGPVISKQYSHFVTGNVSLGITITMLVVPFIVQAMTKHQTQEEWKFVFLIVAGVMVVTNLIFVIMIKGEPCEWTRDDYESKRRTTHRVADVATVEAPEQAQRF